MDTGTKPNILPLCCDWTTANNSKDSRKDTLIMVLCYIMFWSFLTGFSALLLKGAMDSDVNHTLLWTFFVIGLLFVSLVMGAIMIGTDAVEKVKVAKRQAMAIAKMRIELDP